MSCVPARSSRRLSETLSDRHNSSVNAFDYFVLYSVSSSMSTVFFTSCFVILFSSLWRSMRICDPHFTHFILKSMPAYITSNIFPPHGCGFFSSTVSPTFIFIGISSPSKNCRYADNASGSRLFHYYFTISFQAYHSP